MSVRAVPVWAGSPLRCSAPSDTAVRFGWALGLAQRRPGPRQWLDVRCRVRRACMRNCVTRVTPAMATTTPPPTAAISRAIPRGMVPDVPRNWTSTFVEFWRMKTMSRISSRSATPVATQAALARVTRGARRVGGEPASDVVVSAGSSSAREEEGVCRHDRNLPLVRDERSKGGLLSVLPEGDFATTRQHHGYRDRHERTSDLALFDDVAGGNFPSIATSQSDTQVHAHGCRTGRSARPIWLLSPTPLAALRHIYANARIGAIRTSVRIRLVVVHGWALSHIKETQTPR